MSVAKFPAVDLPCGMKIAAPFVGQEGETFTSGKNLPPLPIPPLEKTLEKYIDSGKNKKKDKINLK